MKCSSIRINPHVDNVKRFDLLLKVKLGYKRLELGSVSGALFVNDGRDRKSSYCSPLSAGSGGASGRFKKVILAG